MIGSGSARSAATSPVATSLRWSAPVAVDRARKSRVDAPGSCMVAWSDPTMFVYTRCAISELAMATDCRGFSMMAANCRGFSRIDGIDRRVRFLVGGWPVPPAARGLDVSYPNAGRHTSQATRPQQKFTGVSLEFANSPIRRKLEFECSTGSDRGRA
jgi:hypothetical protein